MAESVLFDLAGNIIRALSLTACQEISRLWGVGDELEKLKNTVSTIQAVLLDAEEKSYKSHQVKNWLERLKDALYDAEDVLDEISVKARLRDLMGQGKLAKEVRTFYSSSNQLVFRLKIANKLKDVITKIDAIKADKPLHLVEHTSEMGLEIRRGRREQTHSFICQEEVIGRDDDRREIIRLLMDPDIEENVSVVSIVGIGGLGKTALAQYVYNDEAIQKHFQSTMWVCVSDIFDIKTIVANIIESAKKTKAERLEMDQMQSTLRKEIDGKRYLLVLDDLWNENREDWLKLKSLLHGGAPGSKILITTRSQVVAEAVGSKRPYLLQPLSSDASLDLFMAVASKETQEITESEKVLIGKGIVEKCGRIPLAIRVIGGMLFFKITRADWINFKENVLQNLTRKDNGINSVLRLSYDHLPSHLKQCFAFCSLFPKDYFIEKSTLISCWISQGFVQLPPSGTLDVEDIAHEYFMYLLQRNFFQDVESDKLGNVTRCKMHDLLHDLACLVAGIETCGIEKAQPRTRHISYMSNRDLSHEFPELQDKSTKVRMLLPIGYSYVWSKMPSDRLSESICHNIISDFRCLRFLALHNTNMKVVPRSLCKLKHLSHLDLSSNKRLEKLPNSIKGLQNLVRLNLKHCECLKELPNDIGSLGCLKHLVLDLDYSNMKHMPQSLGRLTSLRTLTCFIVGDSKSSPKNSARLSELSGLNNLQGRLVISIRGHIENAAVDSKKADIRAKHSLDRFEIRWKDLKQSRYKEAGLIENQETILEGLQPHTGLCGFQIGNYRGARFPQWMMEDFTRSLPNLTLFGLEGCRNCQFLPPLGLLPNLKFLFLHGISAVESITYNNSPSSSNSFARQPLFLSLSKLSMGGCPNLKSLPIIEDLESLDIGGVSEELLKQISRLQKLKMLQIRSIDCIKTLPKTWLRSLSSLVLLCIEGCPNLTSLSLGMQYLPSLETLYILDCEVLDLSIDENHNVMQHLEQGLRRLCRLDISKLPKLTSLPDWIFHVTTLEYLRLSNCSNLVSLSNRMGDVTSLRSLEIVNCPNLRSLPESMSQLKSLIDLRIAGCPELENKCKKDSGEEWHKIAHVPKVELHVLYEGDDLF